MSRLTSTSRWLRTGGLALAAIAMVSFVAEARSGRGGSIGSRGDRTFSAPAPTATAPGAAAPIQKSITQPGMANPAAATAGASAAAAQAARPSMMRNLLLGGLIGAGLASVFGAGALASVLGFVLQALLIGAVIALAIAFFRRRFGTPVAATAQAGTAQPQMRDAGLQRQGFGPAGGALPPLTVQPADLDVFQRLLGEIQLAYGRGDIDTLGSKVTPEMLSYFAHELDADRRKGVRNELGAPTLLQGDVSEAWRDSGSEYATVAMRYSLTDAVVDVASGRVISGDRAQPQEVTELWTFRRNPNSGPSGWELSAIQQSA